MCGASALGLLVICCSFLIKQGDTIPLDQFFPYGQVRDTLLPASDDGSSSRIALSSTFKFFASNFSGLYVNNNGLISFERPLSTYTSEAFPLSSNIDLIAPYWADVDTRDGRGSVFYRDASAEREVVMRAQNWIRTAFLNQANFRPTFVFIVTWERVGYFGETGSSLRNTFQCVLVSNGKHSFVIFLYADGQIQWTTGDASGGTDGFGGTEAHVGFNAADNIRFANVPGSQTPDIVNIDTTTNVGRPGVWMFRVDESEITISACGNSAPLQISPRKGNVLGGTAIFLAGPCFFPSDNITCHFDGSSVPGIYVSENLASCVTPYLVNHGWRNLTLVSWSSRGNESIPSMRYSMQTSFYAIPLDELTDVTLSVMSSNQETTPTFHFTPGNQVLVSWNPESLVPMADPNSFLVNIVLLEIDLLGGTWQNIAQLANNELNDGTATITIPELFTQDTPEVHPVAIEVVVASAPSIGSPGRKRQVLSRVAQLVKKVLKWSPFVVTGSAALRLSCEIWCNNQKEGIGQELLDRLPPCPRTVGQAIVDSDFEKDSGAAEFLMNIFHPGADACFRQKIIRRSHMRSGQQCCYYANGNLATNAPAGGTVDLVSPKVDKFEHFKVDVIPFVYCCLGLFSNCEKYYEKRPSDNGERYNSAPPACVYGDPHIVTLDGFKYTFNGMGEYILIATPNNQFSLQGRMEVPTVASIQQSVRATVFTAVVAKEMWSGTVQFQLNGNSQDLEMLVNGYPVDFSDVPEQELSNVTVADKGNGTLSAQFSSGAYVEVRETNGILSTLLVALPQEFRDQTFGLMGNFNGNISDDLVPRALPAIPVTSSLEDIHNLFGVTWIISQSENSLFSYEGGTSFATFFDPDFLPTFSPTFASPELEVQAFEMCGGDTFCLYDVAATGSIVIGQSTLQGSLEYENIVNISLPVSCDPPCQNGACVRNNTCSCSGGFTGNDCSQPIFMNCDVNLCENGGSCKLRAGSYLCSCLEGFSGIQCQIKESGSEVLAASSGLMVAMFALLMVVYFL